MKKFGIVFAMLLTLAICALSAEEREYKYEYQESKLSYHNVTVYKVLEQKETYIVMYAKGHRDVGSVTIPKKWYNENPAKLSFRTLPKGMSPYMTVIKREGSFDHVILTMPIDHANSAWGVADAGTVVNDADKDSLEMQY
ncbi:MAG: hypothetical protein IJP62_04030 [Treponema sp.]|nr:hypothetical protein [Treponema sp.]